jgi:ferritin-like metal-binding protein YciE
VPATISNPRDLLVQLLGDLLYVERRLADAVLRELARSVSDDELRSALEAHLAQTKAHVDRVETAFRRLEVAPTSNRSAPFEGAVSQHDELAGSFAQPRLADVFHATAALHTEHYEIAAYTAILELARATDQDEAVAGLRDSLVDEERALAALERAVSRLAQAARAR